MERKDIKKYGIIKSDKRLSKGLFNVIDMVEKPDPSVAPSNLAIMGRYILMPEIFDLLETQTTGAGGEIQLTDAIKRLNQKQKVVGYIYEGTRYDVGEKFGYIKATLEFALKRKDLHDDVRDYLLHLMTEVNREIAAK